MRRESSINCWEEETTGQEQGGFGHAEGRWRVRGLGSWACRRAAWFQILISPWACSLIVICKAGIINPTSQSVSD